MKSAQDNTPSTRLWPWILGLCLLFAALRWNNVSAPLVRDEGEYAYAAQILSHGQLPYENSFLQKPPMVVYSYWLAQHLVPGVFWSARLLVCLFVAGATALLGYIARREFGPDTALPVMALVTPMFLLPGIDQFAANTEAFMLLPLLATMAIYVHARTYGTRLAHWFAAGFLGVTTLCYKQTTLPLLALVYAAWSLEDWLRMKSIPALLRTWAVCALGACLAALLELGLFLFHDHGAHLWECTVWFNRYYVTHHSLKWGYFWLRLSGLLADWWILFLAPLLVLIKPPPRTWFWGAMFLLAWLSTSGSYYGHYYLVIMPFWALLTVVGIDTLATAAKSRLPRLKPALTGIVLVLVLIPDFPWMAQTSAQFAANKLYGVDPFLESQAVAKRVAELTSPDDSVLIAGSEPQILYYANRRSPTRFDIVYPMMIDTPLAEGFQREAVRDLQQHPPRLIVQVRSQTSWLQNPKTPPEFIGYVLTLLKSDYEMAGGFVREGTGGHWQEPLSEADSTSCVLVLYRRKTP